VAKKELNRSTQLQGKSATFREALQPYAFNFGPLIFGLKKHLYKFEKLNAQGDVRIG
jgi:hypothetical protein